MEDENKEFKVRSIFSCLLTLSPIIIGTIIWNKIPNSLLPNSTISTHIETPIYKIILVFGLPLLIMLLNIICLNITFKNKTNLNQSKKIFNYIFYICPSISIIASIGFYNGIMENAFHFTKFLPSILGLIFIIFGNNLPKVKQNSVYGFKISWALKNKENWAKTHKFSGYVWVLCGIALLFVPAFPLKLSTIIMLSILFIGVILPIIYSYAYYKKQVKSSTYVEDGIQINSKGKAALIPIVMILCIVFTVMFTGNIDTKLESDNISIDASYYTDIQIPYDSIEYIEYREYKDIGVKAVGFSSFRLSLGSFENKEFKSYTCYVYNNVKNCIAIKTHDGYILINSNSEDSTKNLYDELKFKLG